MSRQRSDNEVLTEAARKEAVTRSLRRYLRSCGIRDAHTSRKARAACLRAERRGG